MIDFLDKLDRRWIFLAMGLSVLIPILMKLQFPETATAQSQAVFEEIEKLKEGDPVLMAWDWDPASAGELEPMAKAFVLHCASKKLKMYFLAIYPLGNQMADNDIADVIKVDFPDLKYGEDYVNLGYKPGYEGVIKVIVNNLRELYPTDSRGTNLDQIPMCRNVNSVQDMKLIINVSSGYPGIKEWVQYASTPYKHKFKLVGGCTGVQASLMYPYIPQQLAGQLGAIKGAAEYESLVTEKYAPDSKREIYKEGRRRMGPQLIAHMLMIGLIILGNIVYFAQRSRGAA